MIDDNFKFGMAVLLTVIGLLFATIIAGMAIHAYRDCLFIKAGYTRKVLPGCHCPQWVKEQSCERYNSSNKEDK